MKTFRLGLEWFLNPDHLPFLIGREQGWFAEAGLNLQLVEPAAHFDAFEALVSGELDAAITEPIHLVEDRAKGRDLQGYARFLHTNGGVMYFAESGITRPRDMAGKRLQYPGAPGPGGPAIIDTMVEADGGTPIPMVPVNNGFKHTEALMEGQADLATLVFYNFEVIEARSLGKDARFFALKDWGVPDFCQLIIVAPPNMDRASHTALVKVLQRGIDFIHQRPEEARQTYFRVTESDPDDPLMKAIFEATVSCFTFDFDMSEYYYANLASWMKARGLTPLDAEVGHCWRHDFA
ncbi:MAG: ABC transporter substrate-binding protein [Myxococcota bacterium]